VRREIRDDTAEGKALRAEVARLASLHHRRVHDMIGVEFGYTYAGSPLIAHEPDNLPVWETVIYEPHTRPGVRIPHVWLKDGRAMQDVLGRDYTLLDLQGNCDTRAFESAFTRLGAPLDVVRLDEPHVREVYGCSLLLLRPDLHIAWRGDKPPKDADSLCALATGRVHSPTELV